MQVLRAEGLCVNYGPQHVLRDVHLALEAAQTAAIMGPSGSGKTTLLYALSGLERATSGDVFLLGQRLGDLTANALSELRLRNVGFVFQSADLVPELTLRQNIGLPLELAGASRRQTRARVEELVVLLELVESADRRPQQVSGGQAQRCAVARAVVAEPAVVFADEPTGALDRANRDRVLELLLQQSEACGALLVTVTHDPEVADRFGRRIELQDGAVRTDVATGDGRS